MNRCCPLGRELTLELPFEVDDEKGKAKFDKVKQTLEVRVYCDIPDSTFSQ